MIFLQLISVNSLLAPGLSMFRVYKIDDRESRYQILSNNSRDPYFSKFISKNTPDSSLILITNEWMLGSANTRYMFPRNIQYYNDWNTCENYPTDTDYIAISIFDKLKVDAICSEYIQEILIFDYDSLNIYLSALEGIDKPYHSYLIRVR